MDRTGCLVEVLGVPEHFPDETIIDKLLIYFLRKRNGGGEVLKVLYPCYQTGQAFVKFEQPEVAAGVLRRHPHVLDLDGHQYLLTVRAAHHAQMDFLVAATLQLDASLDKAEVRDVFISHGFVMEDLSGDQLRVTGPFLKLKSVKTSLEKLLKSPAKDVTPAPSTVPQVSSRDISRHHTDVVSGAKGRQLASKQSRASPSSSTMSSLPHGSCLEDSPGTPDRPVSVRTGRACFTVKPDLFDYASCLRKKDVDTILVSHDVKLAVKSVDDGYVIILSGKRANVGMDKLKTLLDTLKSLRTQEVPLRDLTPEGRRLVVTFQKSRDIYKSVLVQRRSSSLHLVGPPEEVQVLKERLLGRRPDPSQHRGTRTTGKPSRRASSLPPTSRKTEDGAGARRGQRGALVL